MDVQPWVWGVTVVVLVAVIAADFVVVTRRPHEPSNTESAVWVSVYVGLAIVFGIGLWTLAGPGPGLDFFTGWIVEYSMSLDNLFVFILLFGAFSVPRVHRQRALLIGIALSLLFRGVFIALGAAVVERFAAVFFLFGAVLLYTAWTLITGKDGDQEEYHDNAAMRLVRRGLPTTDRYHGARMTVRESGRLLATPMLLVIVALGLTDVMFALDSIPAVFGITDDPYIVFTANAFALMGLRQLYFLLGGLLGRLVYLNTGLALVLAFIGAKLLLHALNATTSLPIPEIPTWLSLVVILVILLVTAIASVIAARRAGSGPGSDSGAGSGAGSDSGSGSGSDSGADSGADSGSGPRAGSDSGSGAGAYRGGPEDASETGGHGDPPASGRA
ncbi:tellurite resistance protein TerC [Murinocardiopsis flavida]|uniref:Tellurite resistance protein TerC n=1 Tax=Murinocardiopsis flavida TaxID=645275 RepID=A0A2P8DL65_9ACTN|nr:tellurite resistance protein TerC [Murinocardiopsis flavida]